MFDCNWCLILLVAYPDVIAVVGSDVSLPCNVSRIRSDNVTLILWYRSDDMISGPPIYSVDARSTSSLDLSKAIHFTPESMSSRAKFDLTVRPAMLRIKEVNPQDDGQYWCRVDYRWTRTTISLIKLNVIGKWLSPVFVFFLVSLPKLYLKFFTSLFLNLRKLKLIFDNQKTFKSIKHNAVFSLFFTN